MSVTTSWGYTNGTSKVTTSEKMPLLGWSNYAPNPIAKKKASKNEDDGKVRSITYTNLTSPTDQPERITVDVERKDNFSLSFPTAYAPITKKGYIVRVKLENVLRTTDEQGLMYDDGAFAMLTFGATDGTCRSGGLATGADWLNLIDRLRAVFTEGTYDISDAVLTVNQSQQLDIDYLMHQVAAIQEPVTQQA